MLNSKKFLAGRGEFFPDRTRTPFPLRASLTSLRAFGLQPVNCPSSNRFRWALILQVYAYVMGHGRWMIQVIGDAGSLHAFVSSHIDYCNAVLAESPRATTDKPQRVLSAGNTMTVDWVMLSSATIFTGSLSRSKSSAMTLQVSQPIIQLPRHLRECATIPTIAYSINQSISTKYEHVRSEVVAFVESQFGLRHDRTKSIAKRQLKQKKTLSTPRSPKSPLVVNYGPPDVI